MATGAAPPAPIPAARKVYAQITPQLAISLKANLRISLLPATGLNGTCHAGGTEESWRSTVSESQVANHSAPNNHCQKLLS